MYKAALAEHDGTVTKIEKAPQGGSYVWTDQTRHYVAPDLRVTAVVGQRVEAGDVLSTGVPKPDEIVRAKGLGAGRKYLVDTLHATYKNAGADVDRRHLETLARAVLNHVYVADPGEDNEHGFLKGDIVNFNRYNKAIAEHSKQLPIAEAVGETLGGNYLHFTTGTRITPSVIDVFKKHGINEVHVATVGPRVEPVMKPASRSPLLNPDWMARLGHRYLKETLLSGAHRGDTSNLHGYNPGPAYAAGATFGEGTAEDPHAY